MGPEADNLTGNGAPTSIGALSAWHYVLSGLEKRLQNACREFCSALLMTGQEGLSAVR